jgi:hypothetical protein
VTAYTDRELVLAIKAKKQFAFDYFYDRYAPAFYGEIKRTVCNEEKAVDVLSKFVAAVWRDIDDYDFKQSFFTWCLKKVRKDAGRQKIDMVLRELFSCERMPAETR